MTKQIFMAIVRGIFWVILSFLFMAFAYLTSTYLDPEKRAVLVPGMIIGTCIFFMSLLGNGSEERFFKKFWHGKFWLPFSVSTLVIFILAVLALPFLVKIPYFQQKHEGSPLLSAVIGMGTMILLTIVQLRISRWLRVRAVKKELMAAIGLAVKRTKKQEK